MIDATISFCDLNTASTAGIPNFAPRLGDVKAKKVLIDGMNQLGSASTKGVTIDVGVLKKLMIAKAFKCANATLGFANFTNNNTLKALVNFTKPKLDKLLKEDVDDICQQIHDAADANIAGATPYGIIASDVTDLQAAIDLYRARTGDSRQAIVSKSQAIKQAHIMIRELIDELLVGQLDVMANTLEETDTMFWSGYFQAREIIDPGTFTTVLKILVLNKFNDLPLLNVKAYRDGALTFKKSSKLGYITFKDIDEGAHSFVLKHKLFKDFTLTNVMISHGKKTKHTAKMEPILAGGNSDPAGFEVEEFHIPPGESLVRPFDSPPPASLQVYLFSPDGSCMVCSTNLPAIPCTVGYELLQGVPFQGSYTGLNLDTSKTHVQFTNTGTTAMTLRIGIKV